MSDDLISRTMRERNLGFMEAIEFLATHWQPGMIYRTETPAPDSEGYFYGNHYGLGKIEPVFIYDDADDGEPPKLVAWHNGHGWKLSDFRWFGPVPVVWEG